MGPETRLAFLILLFAAVFSVGQAIAGLVGVGATKLKVNRRLRTAEHTQMISELVVELRKQRGLDADGERRIRWRWLADLITESGMVFQPRRWLIILAGGAVCASLLLFMLFKSPVGALVLGPLAAAGLAVMVLKFRAARRAKALGEQLPTGLEIVVRSLEAGHPVPTAVALVGREMPDPLGTEFGMAADEVSFGATLEQAVGRMSERCRHPDIDLFAATIRLQERAGGDLTTLLRLNAKTVRERHKMRLRIRAASSEGRASAMTRATVGRAISRSK